MVIKEKQTGHLFKIWMKLSKAFSPISWSSVITGDFLFSLFWLVYGEVVFLKFLQ